MNDFYNLCEGKNNKMSHTEMLKREIKYRWLYTRQGQYWHVAYSSFW